jgi:hypothetical protein
MHTLPQPTVNPAILTTTDPHDAADARVCELLILMDLAASPAPEEESESAVADFVPELLRDLGYTSRDILLRTRRNIPIIICGENREAHTDVSVLSVRPKESLLLVQEDKGHLNISDPEPQLIAEAIAAFC